MTRLALLSDPHFGLHRAALWPEMAARIDAERPDLVLVAGDLTHRGRPAQYDAAVAALNGLAAPWRAVPGNHDVPLLNPLARALFPWREWRRAVNGPRAWSLGVGAVQVIGVDSVDRFAWQRGRVQAADLAHVAGASAPGRINLVMLHHPLRHRPGVDKALMRGAAEAEAAWMAAGVELVLSGHLHRWHLGDFAGAEDVSGGRLLHLQAGTALCNRASDRQNEFCVLDLTRDGAATHLTVTRHIAPMGGAGFLPPQVTRLVRGPAGWRRAG